MSGSLNHLADERLQAYVESDVDAAERALVASHLLICARCAAEVAELHALFAAFATLPRYSPSAQFADQVMTRVRVRQPWFARATAWLERLAPKTTRGWALAAALLALPLLGASVVIAWVISQPGVTPQGLWLMTSGFVLEAATIGWQWTWARASGSTLAGWLSTLLGVANQLGRGGLGLALVTFATLTAASAWILYQNLIRPTVRRNDYASFVF